MFILQELAEHAERLSKYSMLFVITLHQQMDSYSELLSRTNRAEWAKIQERFVNIRFAEPASSTIQMLAEAIKPLKSAPKDVKQALERAIKNLLKMESIILVSLTNHLQNPFIKPGRYTPRCCLPCHTYSNDSHKMSVRFSHT